MAHLKKSASGHLLKTSTGHLAKSCDGDPPGDPNSGCTLAGYLLTISGTSATACREQFAVTDQGNIDGTWWLPIGAAMPGGPASFTGAPNWSLDGAPNGSPVQYGTSTCTGAPNSPQPVWYTHFMASHSCPESSPGVLMGRVSCRVNLGAGHVTYLFFDGPQTDTPTAPTKVGSQCCAPIQGTISNANTSSTPAAAASGGQAEVTAYWNP